MLREAFKWKGTKSIADYQNPFTKEGIDGISMNIFRSAYTGKILCYGLVKFKSGNTEGQQKFDAEDFPELYNKIQSFLNSL